MTYKIYFAGELFDHKHLIGNALLASRIKEVSNGRYLCSLPQDMEVSSASPIEARNNCLRMVMESDLALFNFDGADLDSGTVAEFMFAKFLDIPSVLLRTDIRISGDQGQEGDNWNLMCSGYPRTKVVHTNAIALYKKCLKDSSSYDAAIKRQCDELAKMIIDSFDDVLGQVPLLSGKMAQVEALYQWAAQLTGSLAEVYSHEQICRLIKEKKERGLLSFV